MIRTINYIKHWEGYRRHFYRCPAGKLTIGNGRNVQDNPISPEEYRIIFPALVLSDAMLEIVKNGISEIQADKLTEKYIIDTSRSLLRNYVWFRHLSKFRKIVIFDMIYNLGWIGFMGFKNMLKAIKEGNYVEAGKQIENSRYYSQVGNRAKANVYIMLSDNLPPDLRI